MSFKKGIAYFLYLLSVPKCVSCGEKLDFREKALCPKCSLEFEEIKSRNCSKCAKILSECSCSTHFLNTHYVKKVVKCFRYNVREENNPANALIYSLKRDNRDDVLERRRAWHYSLHSVYIEMASRWLPSSRSSLSLSLSMR